MDVLEDFIVGGGHFVHRMELHVLWRCLISYFVVHICTVVFPRHVDMVILSQLDLTSAPVVALGAPEPVVTLGAPEPVVTLGAPEPGVTVGGWVVGLVKLFGTAIARMLAGPPPTSPKGNWR